MKVVRSALCTGRVYPPRKIPVTLFCQLLRRPQSRKYYVKQNSSYTMGNRTHAFRLVAQCINHLRHRVAPFKHVY